MNRTGRPLVALVLLVVSAAAVGIADAYVAPIEADGPAVDASGAAPGTEVVSGRSVCAVGDARDGTTADLDVLRPGVDGDAPATAEVVQHADGATSVLGATRLFPGAATRVSVDGPVASSAGVRWAGAPITAWRSWRSDGDGDLPPGTAAGPCAAGTAATTWTIPGLTTAGGAEARLRIANPHEAGATVAVGFLTPEGPDEPTRLRNVSVGAHETVELELNEYLPEEPDLAVAVEVASGRVAVEGIQLVRSAIGGIDGVSLLQAATEPSEVWTVPWVVGGEDRSSWLWIANRTDRSAPVELTYHTGEGGVVPQLLAEVSVPPGTVRRIDLAGTLPEGLESTSVTARSDGVPITLSGVVQLAAEEPADTGFAVQLGAPSSDAVWALAGTRREGRSDQLRLVNPGSEPAVVDATLWNGSQSSRPPELAGVEVAPGAQVGIRIDELLDSGSAWALTVRATSGELVAGTISSGDPDGPRHLVASTGAPSSWWTTARAPVRRAAPGTTQRLGTELGIEPVDDAPS